MNQESLYRLLRVLSERPRESQSPAQRRHFLQLSTLLLSWPLTSLLPRSALGAEATEPLPVPDASRPTLLKGGVVLTMDPALGDFDQADVLISNGRIEAVAPEIEHDTAEVVDAAGMIIMPGFVDSHRHMWQGQLRNLMPNGTLDDYIRQIIMNARSHYRPQDVHIGDLLSGLSALNAGVTTLLDWSHIGNSPAHTDAAIAGLQEAGIRAVYAYGDGSNGPDNRFPQDIHRLRREHFSSEDQLLTLALAGGSNTDHWAVAREVGAPITSHINGRGTLPPLAEHMGPDNTYIHCTQLNDEEFDLIADTGGGVSIAGPIEMEMGHGEPPFQQVIDRNIPWSLSNDVETQIPADFFTQMQHAFTLQRMKIFTRERQGEADLPALITSKEILQVATLGGAQVNHLDQVTGSLTPGKQADLLMLDTQRINVMPVNNAYAAVVLGMDTSNIEHVFVAGKALKWQGQLLGVDVPHLLTQAQQSQQYIRTQAGWDDSLLTL